MTRKRKTMVDMVVDGGPLDQEIAELKAKKARYEAKIAGTYDESSETNTLKALEKRLSKTNRELKSAQFVINGKPRGDNGKGWAKLPIAEAIKRLDERMDSHLETQERAKERILQLPLDQTRLTNLIELAKTGEDVEFPTNLYSFGTEQERTDEEHEAIFITDEEEN